MSCSPQAAQRRSCVRHLHAAVRANVRRPTGCVIAAGAKRSTSPSSARPDDIFATSKTFMAETDPPRRGQSPGYRAGVAARADDARPGRGGGPGIRRPCRRRPRLRYSASLAVQSRTGCTPRRSCRTGRPRSGYVSRLGRPLAADDPVPWACTARIRISDSGSHRTGESAAAAQVQHVSLTPAPVTNRGQPDWQLHTGADNQGKRHRHRCRGRQFLAVQQPAAGHPVTADVELVSVPVTDSTARDASIGDLVDLVPAVVVDALFVVESGTVARAGSFALSTGRRNNLPCETNQREPLRWVIHVRGQVHSGVEREELEPERRRGQDCRCHRGVAARTDP